MSARRRIAEARRTGSTTLDLSRQNLTAVPDTVAGLQHLKSLDLSVNGLARLPGWIGELTGLERLNLYGNRLTVLPDSIGNLERLSELNLGDNQLTALPASIGNLASLTRLDLDMNGITALPGSIGRLTRLARLDLYRNQLTDLPASTARLGALTRLDLSDNRLGTLPEPVTALAGLTRLDLARNGLTFLPETIGRLVNLVHLGLERNRLTALPDSIALLTRLNRLDLTRNRFQALPESIGNVTELVRLDLEGNRLSTLPRSITRLENLAGLYMEGNLLPPELRAAAAAGRHALAEFMEGVETAGTDFREAKLVVVGEGEVGKSSLLAAMRGEPFDPARGSTHGIEVKTLAVAGPEDDPAAGITLNAWDFGGQRVYRSTHQLFFTSPSVYVVVWKARQGPMQGFVDYWINLIRRRAGDEHVRIHIVATHVDLDGQHPRIDQASLLEEHGDLIGGFHFVDSATGTGIEDLKRALWRSAAAMPQIHREVPAGWRDLRRSLVESGESYLEYADYLARAAAHGLDEEAAGALARIATELGYWIHYPEISGLDAIVVLKGDWLSTAISLVLDDAGTAARHGLVEHRRLRELWDDPDRPPRLRYDPKFHPALLRLMEKYDISYRIAEAPGRPSSSLIAQLVDEAPPSLGEVWDAFGAGLTEDAQLCEFLDANGAKGIPEGLLHQLIVRWHRRSLGRERFEDSVHWHNGFVIQPDPYSRALIRIEGQRLRVAVKALYPDQFMHEFIRDLEDYVGELWPGFRLKRLVPCGGQCLDPERSQAGLFGLERLLSRRRAGKRFAECRRCWADVPIDALVHRGPGDGPGGGEPERADPRLPAPVVDFAALVRRAGAAEADQIERWTATHREIQKLIQLVSDEAARGPRFYTVELRDRQAWHQRLTHVGVRVVLWCEHSRMPLYVLDGDPASGVYDLDMPRDWLIRSAPWIKRTLKVLWSTVLPGGAGLLDLLVPAFDQEAIEGHLELAEESFKTIAEFSDTATSTADEKAWMASDGRSGAELRRLHAFLEKVDPGFGGLERVQDLDKYLWVHRGFVTEYEPGPPSFA
jgi:internalin A